MSRFARELPRATRPRSTHELTSADVTPGSLRGSRWRQVSRGFHVPADTPLSADNPTQRIVEASTVAPDAAVVSGWAGLFVHGADHLDGRVGACFRSRGRPRPGSDWPAPDLVAPLPSRRFRTRRRAAAIRSPSGQPRSVAPRRSLLVDRSDARGDRRRCRSARRLCPSGRHSGRTRRRPWSTGHRTSAPRVATGRRRLAKSPGVGDPGDLCRRSPSPPSARQRAGVRQVRSAGRHRGPARSRSRTRHRDRRESTPRA